MYYTFASDKLLSDLNPTYIKLKIPPPPETAHLYCECTEITCSAIPALSVV